MTTAMTVRDVPDEVRQALAREARDRGQSLQAFLLGVLSRQAAFGQNRQLLADIERDLSAGLGAGADAPDATELIAAARTRADATDDSPRSRGADGTA